jgi:hypothetical protein
VVGSEGQARRSAERRPLPTSPRGRPDPAGRRPPKNEPKTRANPGLAPSRGRYPFGLARCRAEPRGSRHGHHSREPNEPEEACGNDVLACGIRLSARGRASSDTRPMGGRYECFTTPGRAPEIGSSAPGVDGSGRSGTGITSAGEEQACEIPVGSGFDDRRLCAGAVRHRCSDELRGRPWRGDRLLATPADRRSSPGSRGGSGPGRPWMRHRCAGQMLTRALCPALDRDARPKVSPRERPSEPAGGGARAPLSDR